MYAIEQRFRKLEAQIALACDIQDDEIAANMRRFGSVLICGFVERSIEVIVLERLRNRAHPKVINFVKSHFKKGTNYNCEAIATLLERFEVNWRDEFKKFMEESEKEVEALASTYSVRNSVAHGGDSGITATTLRERCEDAKKIVDAVLVATRI
ncbi:HEPN domain-containing protein [Roseovarius sp. THAF9]|uniref:HEPN domain-containing protein n=1 Tax=Roseovarius sp. THAF9 TaxID=2587847 RepID=UPI0012681F23|nr:HEPN domain-containing protein [Roseovarius sp. THAF9]